MNKKDHLKMPASEVAPVVARFRADGDFNEATRCMREVIAQQPAGIRPALEGALADLLNAAEGVRDQYQSDWRAAKASGGVDRKMPVVQETGQAEKIKDMDLISVNGRRYQWNETFSAYWSVEGAPRALQKAEIVGADVRNGKMPEDRLAVAQQVLNRYKLNEDFDPRNVTHRGWNTANPLDLQCFVDAYYWVGDDMREIKLDFHVKFDTSGNVVDAYAHDMHRKVVGKRGDVDQVPADGKAPQETVSLALHVPVTTNANATPEAIRVAAQTLLDIGLADAASTLESGEGDLDVAQLATDLNIGAPVIVESSGQSLRPLQLLREVVAAQIRLWNARSALEKATAPGGEYSDRADDESFEHVKLLAAGLNDADEAYIRVVDEHLQKEFEIARL